MTIYASLVKPADSGFGQFQRSEESPIDGDFDSIEEYARGVAALRGWTYAIDPDAAAMGDADGEALAARIREVRGAVVGGHDTIVAWCEPATEPEDLDEDSITVESVRLAD